MGRSSAGLWLELHRPKCLLRNAAHQGAVPYAETTVTLECGGTEFTAKGRTVLDTGWKQYLAQEKRDAALPALSELSEGQVLDCTEAAVSGID